MKLIASFTQNQLYILIFHIMKKYQRSPYHRLGVSWKFIHFAVRSKHWTIHISRLAILNWTEWYKQFCCSMYACQDICTIEAVVLVFKSRFEDKHNCFKNKYWNALNHESCTITVRCDCLGYTNWSVIQKVIIFHMYITKRVCGKLMNYNNCRGNSYSKHMYTVCTQCVQYVKGNHVYVFQLSSTIPMRGSRSLLFS